MTAAMVEAPCNRDDALEFVGEMRAPFRLTLGEGLMFAAIGRRQMVDTGQQRAEEFAVIDHTADRNAAEADAVITALAADQTGAGTFAADIVVGERNLQRSIDCLRPGVAEKHPVEIGRRQRRDPARQLERLRMREMECCRVIEFRRLV